MKIQKILVVLFFPCFLLFSCEGTPAENNAKIDKTVEGTKDILDLLGDKAKDVLNDKELQGQLKDILKDVEGEGADLAKILKEKGGDWEAKIEELKNDPKFKEKIKSLGDDGKDILKKLEGIVEEAGKKE